VNLRSFHVLRFIEWFDIWLLSLRLHIVLKTTVLYQLPIYVDFSVGSTGLVVDDDDVGVDDKHARFSVYCVKAEALNVLAVSLIFVCTTQTSDETSTATHVYISKQRFRQSVRVVYGYNIPYRDATPRCSVHVSHPVKHAEIISKEASNSSLLE